MDIPNENAEQPAELTATEAARSAEAPAILYPDDAAKDEETDRANAEGSAADGEYNLKPPEGFAAIDPGLLKEATPVFRELGLGNDQANKLVALVPAIQKQVYQSQELEFGELRRDWAASAKSDPEIGGRNWKDTERYVGRALAAADVGMDPPFRELMNQSGLGNHPEVIRVFRNLGRIIDQSLRNGRRLRELPRKSPQAILYPNDRQK